MDGWQPKCRPSFSAHRAADLAAVMILAGLAAACGGGGSSTSSAPPTTNSPPIISGSPPTLITQGLTYDFTPTASDPDGDRMTFSISNQPSWASFDSTSGRLSGTPGAAHVGTTPGVAIRVSDGRAGATLQPFDLEVQQVPLGSATITWDRPTTNADGSMLNDLDKYRVHYGQAPSAYTRFAEVNDPLITQAQIDNLTPGTWYFAVTAHDLSGNQSAYSAEVSKVINP